MARTAGVAPPVRDAGSLSQPLPMLLGRLPDKGVVRPHLANERSGGFSVLQNQTPRSQKPLAKPHGGERPRRSSGTSFAASSIRRLRASLLSSRAVLVETRPRMTVLPFGT